MPPVPPVPPAGDAAGAAATVADIGSLGRQAFPVQANVGCAADVVEPGSGRDLSRLGAVGSTGSPLSPEGFDWIYSSRQVRR